MTNQGDISTEMRQCLDAAQHQQKNIWISDGLKNVIGDGSDESELLPFPFTSENVQQASMELSPGAQVALESCIGAWKVLFSC